MTPTTWSYAAWRHGGWYVEDVRYPSGAVGCVSRNYPDRKWRIVCDERPGAFERFTYRTRDEAARAEYELVAALRAAEPVCTCEHYRAIHVNGECRRYGCGCPQYREAEHE